MLPFHIQYTAATTAAHVPHNVRQKKRARTIAKQTKKHRAKMRAKKVVQYQQCVDSRRVSGYTTLGKAKAPFLKKCVARRPVGFYDSRLWFDQAV